jgi:vacuolar protein sorting-associated protein 26
MSMFGVSFTTNPIVTITFDGQDSRAKKSVKLSEKETVEVPIYGGHENVSGVVDVQVPPGKKIDHQGIRIEMIGSTGKQSANPTPPVESCFLIPY